MTEAERSLDTDKGSVRSLRFRAGLTFIALNYVCFGASIAFGAAAVSDSDVPWLKLSCIAFAASWLLFGIGVYLAGPGAIRVIRGFIARLVTGRGNVPEAD